MHYPMEMDGMDDIDPSEYVRLQEEYEEQMEIFMRKYLGRQWPACVVCILGIFQLAVCLCIFGIDLPIILMYAPRWQVLAASWGFIFTFIASVSTLHSTRRVTWSKLKWTAAFNILGGIAAALMVIFNLLFIVNPKICLVSTGCSYLSYTYAAAKSFYVGEFVMSLFFVISVFVYFGLFIKHGIGGVTLYEDIQRGWAPPFQPVVPQNGSGYPPRAAAKPVTGPGVAMAQPRTAPMQMPPNPAADPGMMMREPPPPNAMPGFPPPPLNAMPRYPQPPPNAMPRYPQPPPNGMPRYPQPLPPPPGGMMPRPRPPMMMMPGQRPPMQGYQGPPRPYFPPGMPPQQG